MSDTAVPVHPAATVMLVRDAPPIDGTDGTDGTGPADTARGIEVFMLRRTLGAAFASGMYVFPGGRVETSDGADVDRAYRLAAIRECFEEAGVLLAVDGQGRTVRDGHPILAFRNHVYDGTSEMLDLCAEHGLTVDVGRLAYVSRWITPLGETRRFDTRFYIAPAPHDQTSVHDDNETIASLWVRPADALARGVSGELTMLPPTISSLRYLAQFDSVAAVMAAAHSLDEPSAVVPRLRTDGEGRYAGIALPGDADYDALA